MFYTHQKYEMQPALMQHTLILNAFMSCTCAGCVLCFFVAKGFQNMFTYLVSCFENLLEFSRCCFIFIELNPFLSIF